tara:strand:+ start:87 stop:485 length:399 start_codon:yes stop_codon:yes gene_type:complete
MAFKLANLPDDVLPYKIATETDFTGLLSDITQSSGTLNYLKFKSTTLAANSSGVSYYVKISFSSSAITVGTSTPDMMFQITGSSGGTEIAIPLPGGIPFSTLSLWVVDSNADNATTRTAPNAGVLSFTAVTS